MVVMVVLKMVNIEILCVFYYNKKLEKKIIPGEKSTCPDFLLHNAVTKDYNKCVHFVRV